MRAADVPLLRDRVLADVEAGKWDARAADIARVDPAGEAAYADAIRQHTVPPKPDRAWWRATLRCAELFYITEPMARLAADATATLPEYRLHRDDLPAQVGLLIWEHPRPDPTGTGWDRHGPSWTAAVWRDAGEEVEIHLLNDMATFTRRPGQDPWVVREVVRRYGRYATVRMPLPYGETPFGVWGDANDRIGELMRGMSILPVTWLLMGQEIVRVSRVGAKKGVAKKARRLNLPTDVRTVTLRSAAQDPAEVAAVGEARHYTHRWYVRGHWRNAWYPSRGVHRPVWIPAYVKGPEGAPLLTGSVVKVLSR